MVGYGVYSLISDGQHLTFRGMKFPFVYICKCKKFIDIAL